MKLIRKPKTFIKSLTEKDVLDNAKPLTSAVLSVAPWTPPKKPA